MLRTKTGQFFKSASRRTFLNASVQEEVYVKTPPGYGSVDAATVLP